MPFLRKTHPFRIERRALYFRRQCEPYMMLEQAKGGLVTVAQRFNQFLSNLNLTSDQRANGVSRREAVVEVLNRHYWGTTSKTANSVYVGSWAKATRVRPPRDVDVLFELPKAVYDRFALRAGNKQSQLLQEVKDVLAKSYSTTAIRGDGPVVVVPFTSFNVELIPAFSLVGGGHWVAMTDNGGHYKKADYSAESNAISTSDKANGNCRDLVRMMKCWQRYCSVPIKSFHIELLAIDFLSSWKHSGQSSTYYDWMVRDFLSFLIGKASSYVYAPGTYEMMNIGSAWKSRAETAYGRAAKACDYEAASAPTLAGEEWQKIFGTDIPK